MKTIILLIMTWSLSISTSVSAQSETKVSQTKSYTSKVSVSSSNRGEENYHRSYSFLDLDNSYLLKIRFMNHMKGNVAHYLEQEFDPVYKVSSSSQKHWIQKVNDEVLYEIELKGNRLKIYLNKRIASKGDIEKLYVVAEKLKEITARPAN